MQELHLLSIISTSSSIVSLHSSTNLFTDSVCNLNTHQYHVIYHISHSQLLRCQIQPLSHTPLLINSLHSHLHLFLFQCCLLLQTIGFNLHSHLHVSCHFICLVSLVFGIKLNTYNIRNTYFCIRIINIITLPLHLFVLILKG